MELDGNVGRRIGSMNVHSRQTSRISMFWVVLALLAIAVLGLRLQLSFDLSVFFPQKTNLTHDVLLEQLRNGPGSRLIVIGLSGSDRNQLESFSDRMKQDLIGHPAFVNVLNGDYTIETAIVPEPVNSYYLLLGNIDYSKASLQQALQLRFRDLAFGGGTTLLGLIAKDPFLQTLEVLRRLVPINLTGEMWFAKDGSAVLMAETKAPAVDIAAQALAILAVQKAFLNIGGSSELKLEMTGVGAFGVELQGTIRAEAKKRTILATGALLLVLLVVYRKPRFILLAALPIGMGFIVGLAVVTLVFGNVHGITLAFGFTLMGIAIDYPLHLFSHSRNRTGREAIHGIWPTLRIGAASTAIAYLAIALSGSKGLAQLGIFTASGVIIAALVTRTWLPLLVGKQQSAMTNSTSKLNQVSLNYLPAFLTLAVALLATHYLVKGEIWEDSLSSLSPVPEQRLLTDNLLRSAAGTPDMRYQLVLHAESLEDLLRESEEADQLLNKAADDGLLESWQSVSLILPSQFQQQIRQDAIPDDDLLRSRLNEVLADSPFQPTAFELFASNANISKNLPPLLSVQFDNTPLESWLDSHLIHLGNQWVSLITLNQPRPEELAAYLKTWKSKLELVDLHQSSLDLVRDYRNGAIKTILLASFAIIALLMFEQKQPGRIIWIALTVIAALSITIAIVTSLHTGLTIIHLVALLLVMGLGLDYALFLSRTESKSGKEATRHAVLACAATTTLTFSILAASSIPVLKFLGLTVAVGSAASFLLAFAGSWILSRKLS
jgi:predicted exporter